MISFSVLQEAYRSRNNPESWVLVAHALWRIVLMGAILMVICGIGFGVWNVLYALGVRQAAPMTADLPSDTVSREQLTTILEQFAAREQAFTALGGQETAVVEEVGTTIQAEE